MYFALPFQNPPDNTVYFVFADDCYRGSVAWNNSRKHFYAKLKSNKKVWWFLRKPYFVL